MCQSFAELCPRGTRRRMDVETKPRGHQIGVGERLHRVVLSPGPGIQVRRVVSLRRVPGATLRRVPSSPSACAPASPCTQLRRVSPGSAKCVPNGHAGAFFAGCNSRRTSASRRSALPGDQMAPAACLRRVPGSAKAGSPSALLGEVAAKIQNFLVFSSPCICNKTICIYTYQLYTQHIHNIQMILILNII